MVKATRKCSVEGCGRKHYARTWCNKHYKQWSRTGDPTPKIMRYSTPGESFAARTEWRGDCLIWTGAKDNEGYGKIVVGDRTMSVHRYSWEQTKGPIPDGMMIDHMYHCDPSCCNPDHLRLATNAQNCTHRSGPSRNSTSGIRNVYWDKQYNNWIVKVHKNGKGHHFGSFKNKNHAALVAKEAREKLFGDFSGN